MRKKRRKSTQQLLGIIRFTRCGVLTEKGELIYFSVRPTNLAVLSAENVEAKINHLSQVFQALHEMEIICTDSCERFDANKAYLHRRLDDERSRRIRRLLKHDLEFFDNIQTEASASRQFIICIRNRERHMFTKAQVNEVAKKINEQNLEARHLKKNEIKRMTGIYFSAGTNSDRIPDYDGQQYVEEVYYGEN